MRKMVVLVLAVGLLAGACGDGDDGGSGGDERSGGAIVEATLAVKTSDYSFDVPASVEAGPTLATIENAAGGEAHQAQFFKLNPGKTLEELMAPLGKEDIPGALAVGAFAGGVGITDPGTTSEANAIVPLTEGTWVLLCFVPSPDGTPHIAKGMVRELTVTAGEEASLPESDGEIGLEEFGFEVPEGFTGHGTFTVTNNGQQPHELAVVRLGAGKTAADVSAFLQKPGGPPPYASIGGVQALLPTSSQQVTLDLAAGEYAFLCYIPDVADGTPHVAKGMITGVTIS